MIRILSCIGLVVLLAACQTPRHQEFEKVQVGMDKTDVLEATGGPNTSMRWNGKDRWIYDIQTDPKAGRQVKEIHFENGKAVYVGEKVKPAISAEEQDRLNAESNLQEEARLKELEQRRLRNLGVVSLTDPSSQSPGSLEANSSENDDEYTRKLRYQLYGVTDENAARAEEKKRAPVWEPVR